MARWILDWRSLVFPDQGPTGELAQRFDTGSDEQSLRAHTGRGRADPAVDTPRFRHHHLGVAIETYACPQARA
jgi:hypothetical protein